MRKLKFLFLLCSLSMMSIEVSAYGFSALNADGVEIYYNITSSTTCEVTYKTGDFNSYSGIVSIPESVSFINKTYSVTSIGVEAFGYCTGLTSVTIPNSVVRIESSAFYYCTNLTSITIPNSVTSIGDYAFHACMRLTSVTIGISVTSIGWRTFYYCTSLTSIEIPNSMTSIGYGAFEGCTGLTSVTIPNSVTSIGSYAFGACSGLKSIIVENGNAKYDSRNNCNAIIETATNTLIQGCNTTIIPNSVTGIDIGAFQKCASLTSITIPNSVASIGGEAFKDCTNLENVYVYWTKPISINESVFDVNKSGNILSTLWVPVSKANFYRAADVWGKFVEIKEYETPEDVSYYITINGLEGGEIMQKVDIGMTYSYKFKPYEEWEINSVTFNGQDVTSQLQDSIFSTPAIAGNSTLSVVYKKVSSAIDAVEGNDDIRVLATSGAIVINGAKAGKAVSVYGLNGNMVESTKTNGASTIVSLPQKGVYIVKVGNDVFKVSI